MERHHLRLFPVCLLVIKISAQMLRRLCSLQGPLLIALPQACLLAGPASQLSTQAWRDSDLNYFVQLSVMEECVAHTE